MTETLNIDYHTSHLIVKALNKGCCQVSAAKMLGITIRQLQMAKARYGIVWQGKGYGVEGKHIKIKK